MTVVQLNFDASTVDPVVALEALPSDNYMVALVKAEPSATKAKDAHYLALDFVVQEGQYKGRHLYKNLNLWNPSETAKEIAWRQLSGLCHAAGVLQVATVDQLFGIVVMVQVIIEQDDRYGPTNRLKAFSAMSTGPAPGYGAPPGGPAALDAGAPWNQPAAAPAPAGPPGAAEHYTGPEPAAPGAPPWGAPGASPAAPAPAPAPVATPAPAAPVPATTAPPWAAETPAVGAPAAGAPGAAPPWAQ
jgi:hypothetical protein